MKIIATAIALVIAFPAAAQTAPAPLPPAAQHQQHSQMHHGQMQHGQMQHGQMRHGQHDGHANMADCCADRNGNGRMDCCEAMEQGNRPDQPASQPPARQNR
jgi:uncharacterized protein involved in copper resistance